MTEHITGIIGGTGLADALAENMTDIEIENIDTPFGKTSQPIMLGSIGKNRIAFINRHGKGHSLSPSVIPYRANIFALKQLGVTSIIASGAVGSLRAQIEPGHLVLVDQFIDKTTQRQNSFFDKLGAVHCEFAWPFSLCCCLIP